MQDIYKFNLKFYFFELEKNILLLNSTIKNYSKKLIYIYIFIFILSKNLINN